MPFRARLLFRRGFLARVFEQQIQRLLATDVARNAPERPVLLERDARGRHRLAPLLGDPLHFAIHLVLQDLDSLAVGDLLHQ